MKTSTATIAMIFLATATASLSTAGTPELVIGSPRALQARPSLSSTASTDTDYAHGTSVLGSPRAIALATDLKRVPGTMMDCCKVVLAKTAPGSPRDASTLPTQLAAATSMKCEMGHQASAGTGDCVSAHARKASCCG